MAQCTLRVLVLAASVLLASCGNYVARDYPSGDGHEAERVVFVFRGNDGFLVTIYDNGTSAVSCKSGYHLAERLSGPHPEVRHYGCDVNPPPETQVVLSN